MTIPTLQKNDFVLILWHDTFTPKTTSWMSEEEHQEWKGGKDGGLIYSAGFVVSVDENYLNIVGDLTQESDGRFLCRPINIAKGCIYKIHKPKLPKEFKIEVRK